MLLGSASPGNLFGNLHKRKEGPHGGDSILGSCSGSIPLLVKELKGRKISWHPPGGSREISLKSRQQQTELAGGERLLLGLRKHMRAADTQRKGLFAKGVVAVMGSQKFSLFVRVSFSFLIHHFFPFIPSTPSCPYPLLLHLCAFGVKPSTGTNIAWRIK